MQAQHHSLPVEPGCRLLAAAVAAAVIAPAAAVASRLQPLHTMNQPILQRAMCAQAMAWTSTMKCMGLSLACEHVPLLRSDACGQYQNATGKE